MLYPLRIIVTYMYMCINVLLYSYLKMLLDPFNEIANKFVASLGSLADGKTEVPMKTKFGEFTLEVISKV